MNIHKYQAKELLAKYGIGIPAGHAALTVEEAVAGAEKLPGPLYVVKAQIQAQVPGLCACRLRLMYGQHTELADTSTLAD